tara:strand:- start:2547 stop:4277 length:1731 start_codon:yes stop_codon:yes gene_type:complete
LQAISGLMDMGAVISIVPFLTVVVRPEHLESQSILADIKNWSQLSDNTFLISLGVFSVIMLLINQVIRLGTGWYGQLVVHQIWLSLHNRMFSYYLNQSYMFHIQNSGNELHEKLQIRVNAAVAGVISPAFFLLGSFFCTLFLVFLMLLNEPMMTVILLSIMITFYLAVYRKIKFKLDYYGKIGPEFSASAFKLISGAFGGIKEVKIHQREKIYVNLFEPMAKLHINAEVKKLLFMMIPGGMIEVIAFGGILLITILLIGSSRGVQEIIPVLGLFALAMKRILPAIQDTFRQIAEIRFYRPSLQIIYSDLIASLKVKEEPKIINKKDRYNFKEKLELKNLVFSYPGSSGKILDSISLQIPFGSMFGICGPSGTGKTTLLDLILGLFKPNSGKILLDNHPLKGNLLNKWQSSLGYVSQTGFIIDGSISENIAFGLPKNEIDMKRIREVSEIAQMSEYIESELPLQYETEVGERGVRLSGGQCQRICIARALYNDPQVLILDEATSSLDGITEEKILSAIRNLAGEKTILLTTHRLTTLQDCDTIILLNNGVLVDKGSYQHLIDTNMFFKSLARDSVKK